MKRFTSNRIFAAIAAFFAVLFLAETNFGGTVQNPLDTDSEDKK